MEYRLRHHDGQYRWIVDRGVPRSGPDGTFLGYIGSCFDIHDRKQSQVALFASEQHLRLATEGARIGTWHWDLVTNRANWNEIECELIGCDPDIRHTTAEEFFSRVHTGDRSELRRAVQRAIERDEPYDHEFRVILPGGQTRWLAGKGEVYRDELGRPLMMMGVNFDISDRKQLELQLTLLNESLEQQVADRINTINLMSKQLAELADNERQGLGRELHDTLGQDCTAISMLVTTLKHQLRDMPQHMELVNRLEYTAEAAKKQVRRLAKGLFPVDMDADGLRVALEDLAEETGRVHRVKCRLDCRSSIHWLDNFAATQLYLVVREAVHNAVKHAQPSQIVIRVEDSPGRRVFVWDDGYGLHSTGASTGMGLSIMRYRCELIGGQLRFESHKTSGTTVSIVLPGGPRGS
jgi:PAS domain S-box-containing protein